MYPLGVQADPSSLLRADDVSLPPCVAVRTVGNVRGLFATRAFAAGEAILLDRALICERPDGSLWVRASLLPDDVDAALLSLAPTCASRAAPPASAPLRSDLLAATLRVNSFGVGGDAAGAGSSGGGAWAQLAGGGVALYPRVSLVNHACAPTARTFRVPPPAGADGAEDAGDVDADEPPARALEARTDIAAGQEITISYVPPTWARAVRRARLRSAYDFECACARCAAPWDDTRVFRCAACGDGRVYGGALECADCGAGCDGSGGGGGGGDGGADGADGADDDATLAALTAPGRPSELVQRLVAHPVLAPEDVRVWLSSLELLPLLAPAPALARRLRGAARAAAARMPFVCAAEHAALAE
jgi:hypothetical protein